MIIDCSESNEKINRHIDFQLDRYRLMYLNKDAIIPLGKYKGRIGKITSIILNYSCKNGWQLCALIQPYRLQRKGQETVKTDKLIWDDIDARTYRSLNDIEIVVL